MHTLQNVLAGGTACLATLLLASCGGGGGGGSMGSTTGATTTGFVATHLVSNINTASNPYSSSNADTHLVNAWGIAFNPQGFVWVANNGTSTSTLYDGNGVPQSLVVAIPPGAAGNADPTGIVFNDSSSFVVTQAGVSGASAFIFVGEAGTISGWSPAVNMNNAVRVVDGAAQGKVYKGLAIASQAGALRLYATDFHNGRVDVFDANFAPVVSAGAFSDVNLPAGYAPFGIQAIGSQIFVSYAMQDAQARNEVLGAGLGAVDVFDTAGALITRLIAPGGKLDAPWGMVVAPASFGPFGNDLLVGNLGDGTINAFNSTTGALVGTLADGNGTAIAIDGLWGLAFGNGINSQPTTTLFYAAGPAGGTNGVYGRIDFH
ncbi:MAG: TIGR03118 family protein [Pseudomonadota bacterium]|nr:TIGR03118 family protein [Pseudomonadota bacterium]